MAQGIAVEIQAGESGPVVVKAATDDVGRTALAAEVQRLQRAPHPGVVELLASDEDHLVLAWAGEQTFALVHPPVPIAAAMLAAVAATVADLHAVGLVHGRLEPSHVIVGPDGRPRLCGFRGTDRERTPAAPADDVAAVGRLIDQLLGTDAELDPIPDRRWARRRSANQDRRSLLAVADRATQEDPAQRPTARALAQLIADAVPDARLPQPAQAMAPLPPSPPALDAVDHPLPPPPEPSPVLAPDDPPEEPEGDGLEAEAIEAVGVDLRSDAAPSDDEAAEAGSPHGDEPRCAEPREVRFLGMRVEPAPAAPGPPDPPGHRPRPPQAQPAAAPERRRIAAPIAAAIAVAAVGLLVAGRLNSPAPATHLAAPVTAPTPSPATSTTARPATTTTTTIAAGPRTTAAAPAACRSGQPGCAASYAVDDTTISDGVRRWTIGQPGDAVAVGDWDCDGVATPALVRPASGEVFVFTGWPTSGDAITIEPAAVVPGARSLIAPVPGRPCATPTVRLAGGGTAAIPTDRDRP